MSRTIATLGDIYGSASVATFSQGNVGPNNMAKGGSAALSGADISNSGSAPNPIQVLPQLAGTIFGNGVFQIMAIIVVAIGIYALIRTKVPSWEEDFGTPRLSVGSFVSIGFQAWIFFAIFNSILRKYNIPGLSGISKVT